MTERMFWSILSVCLCLAAIDCPNTDVNIEAVPGENVSLFSTSDRTWTSLECRRNLSLVVLYRQDKIMPKCCPLFEGRVQVSTEGNLSVVLTNVTYKDSGVYTCELLDSREKAKRPRVFSIILKVAEKRTIDAKPGDDVTLFSTPDLNSTSFECKKNSSLVKFRHNKTMPEYDPPFKGRVLVLRDGNLSVVLTNVTHKDSGVYTCELLDSQDEAKRPRVFSIILKVPEKRTIDAKPGDDVTLFSTPDLNSTSFECKKNSSLVVKFRHNKTMPEYDPPFKGRVLVLRDGNLLSVVLTHATYNDSGVYTCELLDSQDEAQRPRVLNITLKVADGAGLPVWIAIGVVLCIFVVSGVIFGVVRHKKITEGCRKKKTQRPGTVPTAQYRAVSNGLHDPVTVPIEGGDLVQMEALATSTPPLSEYD